MKRRKVSIFMKMLMTMALLLTTTSCMNRMEKINEIFDTDENLADACIKQLFNAIKGQDKDSLKHMFSKKALIETKNIDADIDKLFSFIQGELVSWVRQGHPNSYETVEYGDKTTELNIWFNLDTDNQKYVLYLIDYPIDTIEPENEGLHTIVIIRAEEDMLIDTWANYEDPGIYFPDN